MGADSIMRLRSNRRVRHRPTVVESDSDETPVGTVKRRRAGSPTTNEQRPRKKSQHSSLHPDVQERLRNIQHRFAFVMDNDSICVYVTPMVTIEFTVSNAGAMVVIPTLAKFSLPGPDPSRGYITKRGNEILNSLPARERNLCSSSTAGRGTSNHQPNSNIIS